MPQTILGNIPTCMVQFVWNTLPACPEMVCVCGGGGGGGIYSLMLIAFYIRFVTDQTNGIINEGIFPKR